MENGSEINQNPNALLVSLEAVHFRSISMNERFFTRMLLNKTQDCLKVPIRAILLRMLKSRLMRTITLIFFAVVQRLSGEGSIFRDGLMLSVLDLFHSIHQLSRLIELSSCKQSFSILNVVS
jgi:hypothetical protein